LIAALPLAARVLWVLAAMFLVASFTLALLLPPTMTLSSLIARVDHTALVRMQDFVRANVSDWAWTAVVVPMLARPDWLVPLAFGIVFAGLALSVGSGSGTEREDRRRGL
jgi:hypothetical protein